MHCSEHVSLVYVAAESVQSGHLAPLDAPGFTLNTFLHGFGDRRAAMSDFREVATFAAGLYRQRADIACR